MKLVAGFALAAALVLAPGAHAQLSCDEVEELMDLAWDDFDPIVTDEISDALYGTDYFLENAEQCYVGYDISVMYACLWVSTSESEAVELFDHFAETLDICIPGWAKSTENPDAVDDGLTPLRTLTLTGEGDYEDFEWLVTLDRHDEDGAVDWHISVGSSLYW
jgi:hypothetical protein